ncbi:MAG: glutamine synthetase [Alphaproteobacteria bacterium]|nr:glutamine synthetase [Alphaproteobacteria bacterium]
MIREEIAFICCSDIAGQVRGKGFPSTDILDRRIRGVGWCPTNMQITAFDAIAETPFGALGDLLLVPDNKTEVVVDFGDGSPRENFILGDITYTDGQPWECCLRTMLANALESMNSETGLTLLSAFEHEFQFVDDEVETETAYSLGGFRAGQAFGETLLSALRAAGAEPDSFLREYGKDQYEVTVAPQPGVKAADQALIVRELARATALRSGRRVSFTPVRTPSGVGNGVHIHMSFSDADGRPATHDPNGPGGLAATPGAFVAGVLKYLPSIVAFTAPSVVSYTRLTPHRWSAPFNNLGYRDREASMRICPVAEIPGYDVASQFNVEFRAGDAAASPYLQLAAIVKAGLQGIRDGLAPPPPTEEDLSLLNAETLAARGFERLPRSLDEALARLEQDETVRSWFDELFIDVYLKHKRGEMNYLKDLSEEEVFAAYERAY